VEETDILLGRSFWIGGGAKVSTNAFVAGESTLTLNLPTKPTWLDLPRGVRVEIRPVTTAVMAAAQAAASRRLGAVRAADADLDPDMARGLAFAFLVKALARHAVTAWDGIGDAEGKPLPLALAAVETVSRPTRRHSWPATTSPRTAARRSTATWSSR